MSFTIGWVIRNQACGTLSRSPERPLRTIRDRRERRIYPANNLTFVRF